MWDVGCGMWDVGCCGWDAVGCGMQDAVAGMLWDVGCGMLWLGCCGWDAGCATHLCFYAICMFFFGAASFMIYAINMFFMTFCWNCNGSAI